MNDDIFLIFFKTIVATNLFCVLKMKVPKWQTSLTDVKQATVHFLNFTCRYLYELHCDIHFASF